MNKDFFTKFKENSLFTFLFFLLVSCCLWLLQVLNEDYETDIPFNVTVQNIPDNVELVDKDDIEFGVRLHDRGTALLRYKFGHSRSVAVDYSEFRKQNGVLSLPVSVLKRQVANATIGISKLLLTKSKRSRNCIPRTLTSAQALNPSADGRPSKSETPSTLRQAHNLLSLNLSITTETIVSIREIAEVRAAKRTIIKKIVPITPPPGIELKILGNVMNISPGPLPSALSSPPENANTAGTIIRPARKAIPVSKISIW